MICWTILFNIRKRTHHQREGNKAAKTLPDRKTVLYLCGSPLTPRPSNIYSYVSSYTDQHTTLNSSTGYKTYKQPFILEQGARRHSHRLRLCVSCLTQCIMRSFAGALPHLRCSSVIKMAGYNSDMWCVSHFNDD